MVIDGFVYDVTKFHKHPGQFDILLRNAGTDVTKQFHTIHDESTVLPIAEKFKIGKVKEEDKDFKYEVPNTYVESEVPTYYYLLPLLFLLGCLYFMFTSPE